MDWEFDILYAIQSIRTPFFRQGNGVFIHHRKCRSIVDCDRCSALYFKKSTAVEVCRCFRQSF